MTVIYDTSSVFHLEMLDKESQLMFSRNKPWLFETDEDGIKAFVSEDEACDAQMVYRIKKGFNAVTGLKWINQD